MYRKVTEDSIFQKSYWFGDSVDETEEKVTNNGIHSDFDDGLFEIEPKEDIGIEVLIFFSNRLYFKNLTP